MAHKEKRKADLVSETSVFTDLLKVQGCWTIEC